MKTVVIRKTTGGLERASSSLPLLCSAFLVATPGGWPSQGAETVGGVLSVPAFLFRSFSERALKKLAFRKSGEKTGGFLKALIFRPFIGFSTTFQDKFLTSFRSDFGRDTTALPPRACHAMSA